MGRFESILQRSSVSFSAIDSLDQFPQWMALYCYRNNMNNGVYIHEYPILEQLNWQSVSVKLADDINQGQVRVFQALMANSESGTLVFDYDLQQQVSQIDEGSKTVVMLDKYKLMASMEFVLKQIDELYMNQQNHNICAVHPAELPYGAHLCLYKS